MSTIQNEKGWTTLTWSLDGITAEMVDWHFANMEKDYNLWHPEHHRKFDWLVAPSTEHFVGAVQVARQTNAFGAEYQALLRWDDISTMPEIYNEAVVYDHAVLVGRVGDEGDEVYPEMPAKSYVLHQWSATDRGVEGKSTMFPIEALPLETKLKVGGTWAIHATEEMTNLQKFLAQLYQLWLPLKDTSYSLSWCLKIEKTDTGFRYVSAC